MTQDEFNHLLPGDTFKFRGQTFTVASIETRSNWDNVNDDGRPEKVTFCINTTDGRQLKEGDREVPLCQFLDNHLYD